MDAMTTKNVYRTLRRLAETHGEGPFTCYDVDTAAPRRLDYPTRALLAEGLAKIRTDGTLVISDRGHALLDVADAAAEPLEVPAALLDAPLVPRARRDIFALWLCANDARYAEAVATAAAHGYTEDDLNAALTTAVRFHGVDLPASPRARRRGRVVLGPLPDTSRQYVDAVCRDDGTTPRRLVTLVARANVATTPTDAQSRGATGLTDDAYRTGLDDAIEYGMVFIDDDGIVRPTPYVPPTPIAHSVLRSPVIETMHKVDMIIVLSCRSGDPAEPEHRRWQPTRMATVAATLRHLGIVHRASDIADLVARAAGHGYVTVDGDTVTRGPAADDVLRPWLLGDDPATLIRAALGHAPVPLDELRRATGLTEEAFRRGFDALDGVWAMRRVDQPGVTFAVAWD